MASLVSPIMCHLCRCDCLSYLTLEPLTLYIYMMSMKFSQLVLLVSIVAGSGCRKDKTELDNPAAAFGHFQGNFLFETYYEMEMGDDPTHMCKYVESQDLVIATIVQNDSLKFLDLTFGIHSVNQNVFTKSVGSLETVTCTFNSNFDTFSVVHQKVANFWSVDSWTRTYLGVKTSLPTLSTHDTYNGAYVLEVTHYLNESGTPFVSEEYTDTFDVVFSGPESSIITIGALATHSFPAFHKQYMSDALNDDYCGGMTLYDEIQLEPEGSSFDLIYREGWIYHGLIWGDNEYETWSFKGTKL